jgi:predicted aminopeptidase
VQDGFSHWFQGELNNAKLASVSTYYSDVSYFRQLLTRLDEDYSRFYEQLEKTALLEPGQRRKQMEGWTLN